MLYKFVRLAGLFTAVGLAANGVQALAANNLAVPPQQPTEASQVTSVPHTAVPQTQAAVVAQSSKALTDGVYLYGQSAKPDELGSAYIVFETRNGKTVGAFYMPQSSFDCFYGSFEPDKLAVNVVDSYENTVHPYSIALASEGSVAATENPAIADIGLEGYQPLAQVSENDQRILNVCTSNYGQQVWN